MIKEEHQGETSSPSAEPAANLALLARAHARLRPDFIVAEDLDAVETMTWAEVMQRAEAGASTLNNWGAQRADTVALMFDNSPKFFVAQIAALLLGAVPFSIYSTLPPVQIAPILRNSGARIVVCDVRYLDQIKAASAIDGQVEHIVVVGTVPPDDPVVTTWDEFVGIADTTLDFDQLASATVPDDLATIIYTSGTTGPSKGAQLSHRNLISSSATLSGVFDTRSGDRLLSYLPLAHMADLAAAIYWPIVAGTSVTFVPETHRVFEALASTRPHVWFSVPRFFEKLREAMLADIECRAVNDRENAYAAVAAGVERVRLRNGGDAIPADLSMRVEAAEDALFAPLRMKFGIDDSSVLVSGGAPLASEVFEFFHGIGIAVRQTYGMTETATLGSITPSGCAQIGSVGVPQPGVEVKLDVDGEILIRHESVMTSYRWDPGKTAEAFTADGYFRTGDLGSWNADGHLCIIGRKKDLIVNSAGKNMSPSNIENAVRGAGTLIAHLCVVGDARPFNVGIAVVDALAARNWAIGQGVGSELPISELVTIPEFETAIAKQIDAGNGKLSRVEQLKYVHLVVDEWVPGGEELTPTLKMRRASIAEKYADAIDEMYQRRQKR